MDIAEQLYSEVHERAGSPEGLSRLVHLIIEEVDKLIEKVESLDFQNSPHAFRQYAEFLREYVRVKRQLAYLSRKAETFEMDSVIYDDAVRRLKYAIATKRQEARDYAKTIDPDKVKRIKKFVGAHQMGFRALDVSHEIDALVEFPVLFAGVPVSPVRVWRRQAPRQLDLSHFR